MWLPPQAAGLQPKASAATRLFSSIYLGPSLPHFWTWQSHYIRLMFTCIKFIPSLKLQHPQDCLCQSVSPILPWLCQRVSLGYTNPRHSRDSLNKHRWCELIGLSMVWEHSKPDVVFVLKKLYNYRLMNASDVFKNTLDGMISVHVDLKTRSNIRLVGPFASIVKWLINSKNRAPFSDH